jgi:hypothetical protein
VGWARAQGGSPERDIAALFAWEFRPDSPARKGLLDGYTESAELPPHFWERLDLYEILSALGTLPRAHDAGDTRLLRLSVERLSHLPGAP